MHKSQQGVGLVEVLVSLFILAIAVLGFSVLQVRALEASSEALERTNALMIARDLAERIRVNRTQLAVYKTQLNAKNTAGNQKCKQPDSGNTKITTTTMCTTAEMVNQDVKEVLANASQYGFTTIIDNCQGGGRQCVYVSWGTTTISAGNLTQCVRNGVYEPGARCLVMEAY